MKDILTGTLSSSRSNAAPLRWQPTGSSRRFMNRRLYHWQTLALASQPRQPLWASGSKASENNLLRGPTLHPCTETLSSGQIFTDDPNCVRDPEPMTRQVSLAQLRLEYNPW